MDAKMEGPEKSMNLTLYLINMRKLSPEFFGNLQNDKPDSLSPTSPLYY